LIDDPGTYGLDADMSKTIKNKYEATGISSIYAFSEEIVRKLLENC
jgi:hypothetical protein